MKRPVSILMVAVMTVAFTSLGASDRARPLSAKALLERWHSRGSPIIVEMPNGSSLTGSVGRIEPSQFHLLDDTANTSGRVIAYDEIRALVDPSTGERVDAQAPGPTGKLPRTRTSLKAWLIAGIVAGALIVFVFASGLNKA